MNKDSKDFMGHALKVSSAIDLVYIGPPDLKIKNKATVTSVTGPSSSNNKGRSSTNNQSTRKNYSNCRELPPCPFPVWVKKGAKYLINFYN